MSKLSSVLKKTGIAVAAAAMLVTMGAGTVVTQAKTSLPVIGVECFLKSFYKIAFIHLLFSPITA